MYQIKHLEALSGIRAHTIRAWEQRYKLLNPRRTDTNIRYYSDNDLRYLLNIATLSGQGYKISKISKMSDAEIKKAIEDAYQSELQVSSELSASVNSLTSAMIALDEEQFNLVFQFVYLSLGLESCIERLIYPFLKKVGVMWGLEDINPSQEHFVSNLIRQKLIVEIDKLDLPTQPKDTWILFLQEDEFHEIGMLYAYYLLKKNNNKVIYLGANVPYNDLSDIVKRVSPSFLFNIATVSSQTEQLETYYQKLCSDFPDQKVYFTAPHQHDGIKTPRNCHQIGGLDQFKKLLDA